MQTPLDSYRSTGHETVDGWLMHGAIETTCDLAAMQRVSGIQGPVCEIGVHHGRLFILLHLLSADSERSLAVDLFDMQHENVDNSGMGSRDALLRNLCRHGCDLGRIELLAENSLRLTASRIIESCRGRPRLFSIDGGHTAEVTSHDLMLAHEAVCDGGIVILDDYFNPAWPAVSEGACAFMQRHNADLVPIAITSNKFFFAKGEKPAHAYRRRLIENRLAVNMSTVFGREVACFEPPTLRQRVAADPRWKRVRQTRAGRVLRAGLDRWL